MFLFLKKINQGSLDRTLHPFLTSALPVSSNSKGRSTPLFQYLRSAHKRGPRTRDSSREIRKWLVDFEEIEVCSGIIGTVDR